MTLSITRSLWVQCGGETMALPLDFAQAIVDLSDAEQHDSAGVRRLRHGDGYVVLHSLAGLLGRAARARNAGARCVVHAGTQAMAFAVDRVVGQEEIFVKPLGDLLEGHPLFSGVTLGGDGELLPILDVRGLIQEARSERGAARRVEPRARTRRARVLFVDDSLSVRRVGEKFLVEEGIDVTLAVDGEDALARLRAEAFDLVFTDLEMPRLNGYDLIATIRSGAGAAPPAGGGGHEPLRPQAPRARRGGGRHRLPDEAVHRGEPAPAGRALDAGEPVVSAAAPGPPGDRPLPGGALPRLGAGARRGVRRSRGRQRRPARAGAACAARGAGGARHA